MNLINHRKNSGLVKEIEDLCQILASEQKTLINQDAKAVIV